MHKDENLQRFLDANFGFEPDRKWVERVDTAQEKMREFLGGKNKVIQLELEDKYQGLPPNEQQKIYGFLKEKMPEYISQYLIKEEEFEFPYISRKKTSKKSGSPGSETRKINWTKHIKFWCKVNEKYPTGIESLIARMGETYAIYKNKKMNLTFTISTEPLAYACLGNIGENRSCFRQESENPHHKYILGQTPGAFVIFVTHEPFNLTFQSIKDSGFLGRLWGLRDCEKDQMLFCNWYPKESKIKNSLLPTLSKVIKEWLGPDYQTLDDGKLTKVNGAWHNNRGASLHEINWSVYNKKTEFGPKREWNCVEKNLSKGKMVRCKLCGRKYHIDDNYIDEIAGENICYSCKKSKPKYKSDYSGKVTYFKPMIRYYLDENDNLKKAFYEEIPSEIKYIACSGIIRSEKNKKIYIKTFGDKVFSDIKQRKSIILYDRNGNGRRFILSNKVTVKNNSKIAERFKYTIDNPEIKETILTLG